jgi:hypothetical protein
MKIINIKNNNNQAGFTLVEVLLYLSLSITILIISSLFLIRISESFIKQRIMTEVTQQSSRVIDLITDNIKEGTSVTQPINGEQSETLTIATGILATDPIVYSVSSGILYMSEAGGGNTALTNSNINISNISFRNLSHNNTSGTIGIYFKANYINPNNRAEYSYSEEFFGGSTQRTKAY